VHHDDLITRRRWLERLGLGGAAAVATLGGLGLGGCATPPARNRFPELTYAHFGQFRLAVARIDVVSDYKSPFKPPNIEQDMPVVPEQAMRRWAADRLVATGAAGHYAQFVIQDASVVDIKLPKTPGLRGVFTTDQSDRYDASFAAKLMIRPEPGYFRSGDAAGWAKRSRTIAEDITLNDRDQVRFDLVDATMNDLNGQLDRQIRANLQQFLA
jgi:hypothetical protein